MRGRNKEWEGEWQGCDAVRLGGRGEREGVRGGKVGVGVGGCLCSEEQRHR